MRSPGRTLFLAQKAGSLAPEGSPLLTSGLHSALVFYICPHRSDPGSDKSSRLLNHLLGSKHVCDFLLLAHFCDWQLFPNKKTEAYGG